MITASWERRSIWAAQEIADESPAGRPLRRRAGLLTGQWVGKLKGEDRPMAYRALLSLLADADPVMQLAAVASLQALVDDWSASHLHLQHCLHVTEKVLFTSNCLLSVIKTMVE